ncbi:tRNA 2-thiouridine synthesizing protein A [Paracoccus alcaliphilus]|uniref:tRNA 2-thiouridine synthesizing protein A n=1 Tax=Paracoccus alcaliphilus TaxID=34002 RepID=A0A1H8GNW3_9RHOB|nr:sulfurtransferase TusA family protein [Paracoccus alcaliphilus]WCR18860.1 sulfurtransferase TusA family protein [Paracoccus alcaliphilus]SEN44968.1 tRNA 2-thiouridine synthesizing protein A [Paracoccus alcaliphilus]
MNDREALIDARGLLCPLPVLRLRKALLDLAPGSRLRLIATDPAAVIDVPHFCAQTGHAFIDMRETEDGAREFVVERGPSAPSGAGALTPGDI